MCGFIGSLSTEKISLEKLEKSNSKLICRGPDKKKTYKDKIDNFHFASIFNRLSIIDLSSSADQPMFSENNEHILVFNGEIYNHNELRSFLVQKGFKFRTNHSDTEALLNALIYYKSNTPTKLRGQFSFVYVDKKEKSILMCRDRVGQKPLYYSETKDSINFSSNLISLASYLNFNELNEDSIYSYLNYGRVIGESTIFKNIYELKPGQVVKIKFGNGTFTKEVSDYWKLEDFYDNKKFDEEEFYSIFEESVELRTQSDVPYATFLSGGLDSTSIVKSQNKLNKSLNTFSVYMEDKKFDESEYCELVAKKYNSEHKSIRIKNIFSIEKLNDVIESLDEPFADPSYLPTYLLSNEISKYYKMAISGDGGDELLGGYVRVQKSLNNKANTLFSSLYKFYPPSFGTGNFFISKSKDLNLRYNSFLADRNLLRLLKIPLNKDENNQFQNQIFESNYKQLMFNEYQFFLPQLMMYKIDRASMFNSLEVRSPFVDNRLIEYVFSHSYEYFDTLNPKSLLKNYISEDFTEQFLNRKKQGFIFDVESFVYDNKYYFYENINLLNKKIDLDIKNINKIFNLKTRMNANRIWKLSILSSYLNNNL